MQPRLDQSRSVLDRMLQRALPDSGYTPAKSPKRLLMSPVAVNIVQELPLPEFFVGSGCSRITATLVSMPEATVDKHHRPVLREHKVRRTGQLSDMKSIAKSLGEKMGAKVPLRPSILSANARHHAAALRSGRDAHDLGAIPPGCLRSPLLRAYSISPIERTQSASQPLGA